MGEIICYHLAMTRGLQVKYLYNDTDIIELRIIADNGRFCGTTNVYVSMGELPNVAEILRGFPKDSSDCRDVTLGAFGRKSAGGAVRLRFYCTDLAGHTTVEITIEADEADYARSEVAETATVIAKFEPAALDEFLKELPELEHRLSGGTTLSIL
jgi:hypothetical protein